MHEKKRVRAGMNVFWTTPKSFIEKYFVGFSYWRQIMFWLNVKRYVPYRITSKDVASARYCTKFPHPA